MRRKEKKKELIVVLRKVAAKNNIKFKLQTLCLRKTRVLSEKRQKKTEDFYGIIIKTSTELTDFPIVVLVLSVFTATLAGG